MKGIVETLYQENHTYFLMYAKQLLGNDEDAEDVEHDAIYTALVKERRNEEVNFNFILTTIRNKATDLLRKKRRKFIQLDKISYRICSIDKEENSAELLQGLNGRIGEDGIKLSPLEKQVWDCCNKNYPTTETARCIGICEDLVRKEKHKIKLKMCEYVKIHGMEDNFN